MTHIQSIWGTSRQLCNWLKQRVLVRSMNIETKILFTTFFLTLPAYKDNVSGFQLIFWYGTVSREDEMINDYFVKKFVKDISRSGFIMISATHSVIDFVLQMDDHCVFKTLWDCFSIHSCLASQISSATTLVHFWWNVILSRFITRLWLFRHFLQSLECCQVPQSLGYKVFWWLYWHD